MEQPLEENVRETEKYAFLLGCSLRDNNLEQFFSVYDEILPKHLSERQLDRIKERAREVAELPESRFNELVLSARNYSLAQGPLKMSKVKTRGSDDWNSASEEEDEGHDGKGGHYIDTERDSGLPSTGRTASSYGDLDISDSEERGVYDYFPTQETKKKNDSIKISHTDNPDYDEAIDVESDKSSVDSPRSDASSTNEYNVTNPLDEEGTEMKIINSQEFPASRTNIHKVMYGTRNEIPYRLLNNGSDDEEYCQTPVQQQRKFMGAFPKRSVDDTVQFSLRNAYSQSPEEAESGGFIKPPFGCRNQLNNVGSSIERLLSPAHVLGPFFQDETKKKKPLKKKKGSKDDTDERLNSSKIKKTPMQHDENGNPIDFRAHRQMRELGGKSTEGIVSSKKHSNNGFSSHHGEFRETSNSDSFTLPGQTVKDREEGASSTDRKKTRKKPPPPPPKFAEDIPNYVGNLPNVDDLVKFINTQNIDEKQLKKIISQKASPGVESAPKADKFAKKNKEKKGKAGVPEDICDNPSVPAVESSVANTNLKTSVPSQTPAQEKPVEPAESNSGQPVQTFSAQADAEEDVSVQLVKLNSTHCEEEDMGNSGDKAAASSLVESPSLSEEPLEQSKDKKVDTKMGPSKDTGGYPEKVSSSKSPPLQKKEIECKDKNKNKTKEKEKSVEPVTPAVDNNKKQKGKTGKPEGQLKNNKKLEVKNDVLPDTVPVDQVDQGVSVPDTLEKKLESDLEINENQHYIFTDIGNIPLVEQEFTLVSKKKKRQGAKEVFPEFPRPKNGPREYRGVAPTRSVTPPPSSVSKKEQTRDLSPSSFPALGKKANVSKVAPKFREGRRNSFGDVPIDTLTELRSQDDSDIESVKSLPAAKGGSLSDIVSSRFPVSYAKMAAAPKPPLSPNSPQSDEDDHVYVDSASSRKPTVWKGSPTERRHSIGSSPEDTKQENSPKLSQRSRQKSGSQEFLLSDSVKGDVAGEVMDVQSSPVNVKHVSSSDDNQTVSEETLPGVSQKSHIVSPEDKSSSNSSSVPTITLTLDSSKETSDIVLSHPNGPKKVPLNGPLNGPSNGPQTIMKTEILNHTDMLRSQPSVSSVSKDSRSKPVPVRVNNANSKKNNKSVIFLDKRFSDAPEKLDITFGFDSNFDHQDGDSRHSDPIVHATVENQQDSVSIVNKATGDQNQSETQPALTLPKEKVSKSELISASSIAPKTSTAPSPIPNSSMGTAVLPGSTARPVISKVLKAQVGGLNGVVLPKTQGSRNSLGADVVRTDRAAEVNSVAANKDKAKAVLFFYGEGIVVKTDKVSIDSRDELPRTSQPKRQHAFSPDATASEGKFNVNEAIKYLKQEWDRVLEQQDKNPQAVQFYNGQ